MTNSSLIYRVSVGELGTNCWIVPLNDTLPQNNGECLLVDPGAEGGKILARLAELQLRLRYIVMTHAHLDHMAALPELAAAWPDADIAVHPAEAAKLGPNSLELHREDFREAGAVEFVDALWRPFPEASLLLKEGDNLGPFRVRHVPGHSPGSIVLHWAGQKILLSGDTLFNAGVGRTDLYGGDLELLAKSLARLFTLPEDTEVFPGHGPKTTIGREKKRNTPRPMG
jgi:glyoxylase-like metal-dependent hydrolase (beta-lactamase superfamily II)